METVYKRCFLFSACLLVMIASARQTEKESHDLFLGLTYRAEAQASFGDGHRPLGLNANRYGLSSLDAAGGYLRASIERSEDTDSGMKWRYGYALDLVAAKGYTGDFVVQQAYIDIRWLNLELSAGSRERPIEMKNDLLSSGSMTLGKNARPVPQLRLALKDYYPPLFKEWVRIRGHIAYGMMTDDSWQHEFTGRRTRYVDHALYNSKAGYLKIGRGDHSAFSGEVGLEMATLFGGHTYQMVSGDSLIDVKNGSAAVDFLRALSAGGSDEGETTYKNVAGDVVGSWMARLSWDEGECWNLGVYWEHFFEDHSGMFFVDYDGYGEGEEWAEKKNNRYIFYAPRDMLLGAELRLKQTPWLENIVLEYLCTKYQSGPIYHDHTYTVSDHIGGDDNYYNHSLETGWQHWGQVIGNPLLLSPLYNDDGRLRVECNRVLAWHLGLSGRPSPFLSYRMLATWQRGWGTYDNPYLTVRSNISLLAEASYTFGRGLKGWSLRGALGVDRGSLLGDNTGFQLTIIKSGNIFKKKGEKE